MAHHDMYYYDGTNFVPWGGTVTAGAASGGTVNVSAGTVAVSGGTVESRPYGTALSGELLVGTAAGGTAAASAACKLVRFKARSGNAGTVFMGGGTAVTVADNVTDVTTGYPMVAGDDTGWMPASNVSLFTFISSGTANAVIYLAMN